jgi:hypothetical protein
MTKSIGENKKEGRSQLNKIRPPGCKSSVGHHVIILSIVHFRTGLFRPSFENILLSLERFNFQQEFK